jgi:hypothetical protein
MKRSDVPMTLGNMRRLAIEAKEWSFHCPWSHEWSCRTGQKLFHGLIIGKACSRESSDSLLQSGP